MPVRIPTDPSEPSRYPVAGGLVKLAKLPRCKLGEFDGIRRELSLRSQPLEWNRSARSNRAARLEYLLDSFHAQSFVERVGDGVANELGLGGKRRLLGGFFQQTGLLSSLLETDRLHAASNTQVLLSPTRRRDTASLP